MCSDLALARERAAETTAPAGQITCPVGNRMYRFFGLTEAVSWLAQFAGQGFDDAAGLASLILL